MLRPAAGTHVLYLVQRRKGLLVPGRCASREGHAALATKTISPTMVAQRSVQRKRCIIASMRAMEPRSPRLLMRRCDGPSSSSGDVVSRVLGSGTKVGYCV